MADPFADPQELSDYSQGVIAVDDPRSQDVLTAASEIIRAYCGWHVAPVIEDDIVTLDSPLHILSLPTLRLTEVQEVKADGVLVDADTYQWNSLGELSTRLWWGSRPKVLEVTITHGFESVAVLRQLTLSMASRAMVAPLGGTVREQTLASSVTWAQTAPGVSGGIVLMAHEQSLLAPYRIVTV